MPLEHALQQFERGIQLTRHCQKALREAEQKVQILTEKADQVEIADFDPETARIIAYEEERQDRKLIMIASESICM